MVVAPGPTRHWGLQERLIRLGRAPLPSRRWLWRRPPPLVVEGRRCRLAGHVYGDTDKPCSGDGSLCSRATCSSTSWCRSGNARASLKLATVGNSFGPLCV